MRRLVLLALTLVAVPAAVWAVAGSGNHARAALPAARARAVARRAVPRGRAAHGAIPPGRAAYRTIPRTRGLLVPMPGGSTCFVAGRTCSEIPCVEFAQSQSAVLVAPMAGPVGRLRRGGCPARGAAPARPAAPGGLAPIRGTVPAFDHIISATLARAWRALDRRTAAGGG